MQRLCLVVWIGFAAHYITSQGNDFLGWSESIPRVLCIGDRVLRMYHSLQCSLDRSGRQSAERESGRSLRTHGLMDHLSARRPFRCLFESVAKLRYVLSFTLADSACAQQPTSTATQSTSSRLRRVPQYHWQKNGLDRWKPEQGHLVVRWAADDKLVVNPVVGPDHVGTAEK